MTTNIRENILEILMEINEEGEYSHIAIRRGLEKLLYLPKQERAFLTRAEGTTEYRLQIDYIIDQFSSVKVEKMKPVIRKYSAQRRISDALDGQRAGLCGLQ